MPAKPIVCGHRGAPVVEPENRISSIHAAAERGATWVEFDVRPAADGVLVLHHDPITADGRLVVETSSAELADVADTFAALAQASPLGFDVEVKTDRTGMSSNALASIVAAELDAVIADERREGSLVVTSFDWDFLRAFRETTTRYATGLLFMERPVLDVVEIAVAGGHSTIAPWHPLVDAAGVDAAHEAGLSVATWTVNEPDDLASVIGAGVDMVIGDDPAAVVAAIEAGG